MAITLSSLRKNLKVGLTLYQRKKSAWRSGSFDTWPIVVCDLDLEKDRALVSWNHNPSRWTSLRSLTRYFWNRDPKKKET